MNAITINDNVINVSYSFGNTNYELEINKPGLELLYTLVLDFIDPVVLNEKYSAGLRRTLYDNLKGHIHKLSDEFGHTGLENISSGLRLKRIVRYQVTNPTYEIRDNHLIINSIYELNDSYSSGYGVDYLVTIAGQKYMIPHEILDSDNKVNLKAIYEWNV
ncbi:hypothetical protein [Parageobacillus thermoglucosidasius]|uniref:Uncharacterized protein n=2 Tax=Anoxybacillaceae TaxID=3120669 RepID=A0AAN1D5X1_PARTM|nr:hypothetical protein [Parageobacillus thermoglucosidasius]REK57136.1 MAG: hypothetical protein C6P36_08295 [Geobacillus sp.]ALF09257.1 hypothetical protein AOT13_03980 [Parageobacillus thermoglucosidasius]ANZ29340.1 hypothetical protein BCV53_03995 [Parageobacillus thermoglucosidasius]APM80078.1 hypothetical protein BCV54_04000 [Parageobacillus thermoglucosidasius]EID42644.1 hypothetical protein GT20_3333 [Parageobacillus thermoglucosidasius TNO-09.020]